MRFLIMLTGLGIIRIRFNGYNLSLKVRHPFEISGAKIPNSDRNTRFPGGKIGKNNAEVFIGGLEKTNSPLPQCTGQW